MGLVKIILNYQKVQYYEQGFPLYVYLLIFAKYFSRIFVTI